MILQEAVLTTNILFIIFVVSSLGWVPSTFVSSRSKKSDTSVSQRPENYMDDEVGHGKNSSML